MQKKEERGKEENNLNIANTTICLGQRFFTPPFFFISGHTDKELK